MSSQHSRILTWLTQLEGKGTEFSPLLPPLPSTPSQQQQQSNEKIQAWELIRRKSLEGSPQQNNSPPRSKSMQYLRLSRGNFYGNKVGFFVLTATDFNHLSDDFRLQTTDRHHKHHLTRADTLVGSKLKVRSCDVWNEIKIKNCNITKPRADVFQASLSPHKLSLPAQLVFFRKVTIILFGVAQHFNRRYKQTECQVSHRLSTSPTDQTNPAIVYWYPLPFIGTAAVVEFFTTVYNPTWWIFHFPNFPNFFLNYFSARKVCFAAAEICVFADNSHAWIRWKHVEVLSIFVGGILVGGHPVQYVCYVCSALWAAGEALYKFPLLLLLMTYSSYSTSLVTETA